MNRIGAIVVTVGVALLTVFGISRCDRKTVFQEGKMLAHVQSIENLKAIFALSSQEIPVLVDRYIEEAKKQIKAIIDIPAAERNFDNTALPLDRLGRVSNFDLLGASCAVLKEVSPDEAIRNAARDAIMKLAAFEVDWIGSNVELYNAFKLYAQGNAQHEQLRADQRYFVDEVMKNFKRAGLELPKDKLEQVKKIRKELIDLGLVFSTNISSDNRTIEVNAAGLAGLDQDFIDSLKRTDDGKYLLAPNRPTYFMVAENCSVEDTRKRLDQAFYNRAYPVNFPILEKIIAKRDELAHLLGYKSYAHLNLENQMIKSPERADKFLSDLLIKLNKKEQKEFETFIKELPESVTLTGNGKLKPWDVRFVQNMYKKNHLAVDEKELSEYFQLEHTLNSMFALYENFFGVKFEPVQTDGFWHPEVKLVEVTDADSGKILAYMLLDLHPRDNKYGHAAHFGVLPGFKENGQEWPAISFVVANFPKSTEKKPSLLSRLQVETLFHEFGHAMHHILGKTRLASFAGTATRTDFVEVPSQMLEDWLFDHEVLKRVSKHYKTGQPLSDEMINNIIALKQFDRGWFWQRQSFLASVALDYFKEGADKDLEKIWLDLSRKITHNIEPDLESHQFASFGHLTGYGARYYGYLWSKVLALDVFHHLKKQGLLRPDAGKRYVEFVLSKGGSKEPDELLRDFLGREPNDAAFLKSLGLN